MTQTFQATEPSDTTTNVRARRFLWMIIPVALVAIVTAGYLGYTTLTGSAIAGCGSDEVWDCSHVTKSRWSTVLLVPVSIPGACRLRRYTGDGGCLAGNAARGLAENPVSLSGVLKCHRLCFGPVVYWFAGLLPAQALQVVPAGPQHGCDRLFARLFCATDPLAALPQNQPSGHGVGRAAGRHAGMGARSKTFVVEEFNTASDAAAAVAGEPLKELEAPAWEAPVDNLAFDAPVADFEFPAPVEPPGFAETTSPVTTVLRPPIDDVPEEPASRFKDLDAAADDAEPVVPVTEPSPQPVKSAVTVGSFGADGFVGDQLPVPTQSPLPDEPDPALTTESEARQPTPRPARYIVFGGDRLNLKLNVFDRPILGDPQAPVVFMELFDYTCTHCRQLNQQIDELRARMGGNLAILVIPVPLSDRCNPFVTATTPQHADACELARLAIAVWRLKPGVFESYHRWLSAPANGRSAAEARLEAERLVDPHQLRAILASNYISQFLSQHAKMYQMAGSGTVPKFYSDKVGITGQVNSVEDLIRQITNAHGITATSRAPQ